MRNSASNPKKRNKFIAGILAAGVAGAALSAGVVSNTPAVLAAPVTVDNPPQNFGFADVVSKVSPAVVSVRVTQDVKPTADTGRGGFASPFAAPVLRHSRPGPDAAGHGTPSRQPPGDRPGIGLLHL